MGDAVSNQPSGELPSTIPRGFALRSRGEDSLWIDYRHVSEYGAIIGYCAFVIFWTFGCCVMTLGAIFHEKGPHYFVLIFMVPFWIIDGYMIYSGTWQCLSTTSYQFDADELVIDRSLFSHHHGIRFRRNEITAIRQILEYNQDGHPTWTGLVIVGSKCVNIFQRQPVERTAWLGEIIAKWAGKELESQPTGKQFDESL